MIYTYNIEDDFPGSEFTSKISNRLLALVQQQIATPLAGSGISSTETEVNIEFASELSAGEKTILDGNTSNPAGGLIAKSTEYFEVKIGSTVILDLDVFQFSSIGIFSAVVDCQYKDGYGNNMNGTGTVDIDTVGLAPINKNGGSFDGTGKFSFTITPTTERGKLEITISSGSLPPVVFTVELI